MYIGSDAPTDLYDDGVRVTNKDELSTHAGLLQSAKAASYLVSHAASSDEPFFLEYAPYLVHATTGSGPKYPAPDAYLEWCDWTSGIASNEEGLCALLTILDESIHDVGCILDELDLSRNTITIIATDNGGMYHNKTATYPVDLNTGDHADTGTFSRAS